MITYTAFIDELDSLLSEAKKLRSAKKMHEDARFRKWRNQLHGLLSQIVQVNFLLPCPVRESARNYGATNSISLSDEEIFKWYQTEMDDTINEIEFIIDSFRKHGEPPKGGVNSQSLEMPKVVTASWLFHHAPIPFWLKVGAIVIAIFSFGVFVGQSELYQKTVIQLTSKHVDNNAK